MTKTEEMVENLVVNIARLDSGLVKIRGGRVARVVQLLKVFCRNFPHSKKIEKNTKMKVLKVQ